MEFGDRRVSQEAEAALAADAALARQFTDLLQQARQAEGELRRAQADGAPAAELRRLGKRLDAALTEVMRAAYAAERVEIGARGYDDRIFRRKAKAKPAVKAWTAEAEALLTLREAHRLGGIVRVPPAPAA
ncbi:MAG TPA: hypothetical protein VGL63_11885 [Streptosporangiaceae bacterium]|jgi:hypothetical protein